MSSTPTVPHRPTIGTAYSHRAPRTAGMYREWAVSGTQTGRPSRAAVPVTPQPPRDAARVPDQGLARFPQHAPDEARQLLGQPTEPHSLESQPQDLVLPDNQPPAAGVLPPSLPCRRKRPAIPWRHGSHPSDIAPAERLTATLLRGRGALRGSHARRRGLASGPLPIARWPGWSPASQPGDAAPVGPAGAVGPAPPAAGHPGSVNRTASAGTPPRWPPRPASAGRPPW
jgi:hypothetical protein